MKCLISDGVDTSTEQYGRRVALKTDIEHPSFKLSRLSLVFAVFALESVSKSQSIQLVKTNYKQCWQFVNDRKLETATCWPNIRSWHKAKSVTIDDRSRFALMGDRFKSNTPQYPIVEALSFDCLRCLIRGFWHTGMRFIATKPRFSESHFRPIGTHT